MDIRLHTIIYELTDEIKRAMTGMLEPVFKEVYRGRAEVREVFRISQGGHGGRLHGAGRQFARDSEVRLLRDNVVIFTGSSNSLKRFKNDASEVKRGLRVRHRASQNFNDIKPATSSRRSRTERVAPEAVRLNLNHGQSSAF